MIVIGLFDTEAEINEIRAIKAIAEYTYRLHRLNELYDFKIKGK